MFGNIHAQEVWRSLSKKTPTILNAGGLQLFSSWLYHADTLTPARPVAERTYGTSATVLTIHSRLFVSSVQCISFTKELFNIYTTADR